MNLGAIIAACENRTGFNDASFRFRWRDFVAEALREYARIHPWPGLESSMEMLLPAGSRYLQLPHFVEDVLSILNTTDSINITRRGEFSRTYPATFGQDTEGQPWEYDLVGDVATIRTTLSGFLWFRSTSQSDVDAVYFTGLSRDSTASGTPLELRAVTEAINADGQSPVTLSTSFVEIHSIAKASQTNGDFYFFDAGDSDSWVSFIPAAEDTPGFKRLQFHFVPSATKNLRIRYRRRLPTLNNDTQSPPPGVDPDFLINTTVGIFYRAQGQHQKGASQDSRAARVLAQATNKEQNFGEPWGQIVPYRPDYGDPDSDRYRP